MILHTTLDNYAFLVILLIWIGSKAMINNNVTHHHSLKRRLVSLVSIIILGVLICLVGYGYYYYSPTQTYQRALTALQHNSPAALQYFNSNDSHLKITLTTLKPLRNYLSQPQHVQAFKHLLLTKHGQLAAGNHDYVFQKTGHHDVLFNKYQIMIKPVYPQIITNHDHTQLLLDKHVLTTLNANQYQRIGSLVPGEYCLKTVANFNNQSQKNVTKMIINHQTPKINMAIKKISFTACGYPGARLYLDQRYQGRLNQHGYYHVKAYPWHTNLTMMQIYHSRMGNVHSATTDICDDNNDKIGVTYPGVINQVDAATLIKTMINSLSMANTNDYHDLRHFFVNGEQNASYRYFIKLNQHYLNDTNIESFNYVPQLCTVTPLDKDEATVTFNLQTNTYSANDDSANHSQVTYIIVVKCINNNIHLDVEQRYQILKIVKINNVTKQHYRNA